MTLRCATVRKRRTYYPPPRSFSGLVETFLPTGESHAGSSLDLTHSRASLLGGVSMKKIATLLVFVLGSLVLLCGQQSSQGSDKSQMKEMVGTICNADNVTQAGA